MVPPVLVFDLPAVDGVLVGLWLSLAVDHCLQKCLQCAPAVAALGKDYEAFPGGRAAAAAHNRPAALVQRLDRHRASVVEGVLQQDEPEAAVEPDRLGGLLVSHHLLYD